MGPQDDSRIREIAFESLAAGEAVEPVAPSRALVAPVYKAGVHLGNWTDGGSPALERELVALLPTSILFMDNVKGFALAPRLEELKRRGCKPLLIFRPYFNPTGGSSPATVEGYAQGACITWRDSFMTQAVFAEAYNEGRVVFKLFNETNIGGEGFARGRAGFPPALAAWKQARAVVKAQFPQAKHMSIANTPGNDDLWFTGDAAGMPYWYHGPEAAKASPTVQEIQQAIISCPFKEMFELADYIGIHVYAQDERQTRGDLQTWYARRHERALRFLTPYTGAGKKLIISECDCGYDQQPDPQAARADLFVWWLANVIAPNVAILTVNQWWNVQAGEGDATWEKHFTRNSDGNFRPVVNAVKTFREGAGPPPEEPPDIPPPPPGDAIQLPPWCSVIRAVVPAGGRYWHLKRAYWQDYDTSGGQHHIYALNPHDPTVTMKVRWENTIDSAPLDKPANEPAGNYAMFGAEYQAWLEGRGTIYSDSVSGMKMPQNQHVNYFLEWEERTRPDDPPPAPSLETIMLTEGAAAATVPITPGFALFDKVIADGLIPNGPERYVTHAGKSYALRSAEHASNGGAYVYYVEIGRWGDIRRVTRRPPQAEPPPPEPALVIDTSRVSPNHGPRPAGERAATVVLHHTGGGLEGSLSHLTNPNSGVSTHYVIAKDGRVWRLVDESRVAWHAGVSRHNGRDDVNLFSIGIELVNMGDGRDPYPPEQMRSLVLLLKDLRRRRQVQRADVVTHKAVALPPGRKTDPSPNFPYEAVLAEVYR